MRGLAPAIYMGIMFLLTMTGYGQIQTVSNVWVSDLGDGTFKNPILHSDYSDPDICRVGDDFYMTSSSFNVIPGLPILHSKDLVNWSLIGHAIQEQTPTDHFSIPQHGNGVWAPSIRYHKGEFYIYYGDPDFGIYMVKAKNAAGPWEQPVLVQAGKGLIDPCPLWDEDGRAYLVHAFAGSRAGIKSILVVHEMSPDGTRLLDKGTLVFDGHKNHPTIEGPKFYKRNGYYYIFAPAGGVSTGWQTVLRSKNVYGPYEDRIVMEQGETDINGPHQGGWVELSSGEFWFAHFQDREAYGRIVHLQPMVWKDDWPIIGADQGNGIGTPVSSHKKPNVGKTYPIQTPPDSDEFDGAGLGLQWQWHANPKAHWAFSDASAGNLRLYTEQLPEEATSLWQAPNLLLQKFPAETFKLTTKMTFYPNENLENEKVGLLVMGEDYAHIHLERREDGLYIGYATAHDVRHGQGEKEETLEKLDGNTVYFQVVVVAEGYCTFAWSLDGKNYSAISKEFISKPGRWIGAKVGLFATRQSKINDSGYVDVDYFRFTTGKMDDEKK